jgi:hypothetical protein
MNDNGRTTFATVCQLALAVGALAVWQSPAWAQPTPIHMYTFNDNSAMDSIGTAHGTVVDNTGISTYTGGALDLRANNGAGSGQDFSQPETVGAYVDLPNGVFTSAIDGGTLGTASLEMWFTTQDNRGWAEAASFGNSAGGEDISDGNGSYVALIPQSGTNPPEFRATTRDAGAGSEVWINNTTPLSPLPTGAKQHVVWTFDHLDTSGGTFPNGTSRLYLNGVDQGSAEIQGFLDSTTLNDVNNWLGRSQWGDPLYDGTIDEFKIYDVALTPGDVALLPDPEEAPLPVLVVDRDTGAISLANQTAGNVQVKGYSITSAAASLDPANWMTIDTGSFDPDGTWTAESVTSTDITESVSGGVLDGGTLAPAASQGIGTPWLKTPFEDLVFEFTLGDGTTGFGAVQYTGNDGMPFDRSDLNGDGDVNVADWSLFLPNSFTTFPGETAVGAYLKGDLDGDMDNDYADFQLFKADFIAANGEAAFAQLVGNVPEPSTLALLTAVMGCVCFRRRRM